MSGPLWYRDREALRLVGLGYLPWLTVLNLAWEIAQLPLYTIWTGGTRAEIAFAVVHCTLGDILIGMGSIALALVLSRARAPADWRWGRVAALLVLLGTGYTAFSEWLNTTLLRWSYSALMPTLDFGGFEIGISPLAQWIVVPTFAFWMAARSISKTR